MKLASVFLLAFLFGGMFFSIFHLFANMDMDGEMAGCPFMGQADVVCKMDLAAHLEVWKDTTLAFASNILSFLVSLAAAVLVNNIAPNLLLLRWRAGPFFLYKQIRERTYAFSYRPLQDLFSNGVLHPKLF